MKTSIFTALLTFLSISIVLALFGFAANRAILTALKTPANILDSAVMYLQIYFLGLPFLFMYNILTSIFNALGESKVPLYLLIFSSVTNIVLDLLAVGVLGWGVAGAAAATVFAQGLAAVILFCLLMQKIRGLEEARVPIYDRKMLAKMVKVAVPSILQQSIVSIGMLLVQSVVNGFGSSVLAGYSAGTRIESICVVPMIALGNAVSTFTAQNIGAGKPERVKEGYRAGYVIVGVFAVVLCLALVLGKNPIISAFVDAEDGRLAFETGTGYLSFIAWFFALIGLKALTDGVLRGSGDVVVFTIANLCNLAVRVFVAFRFAPIWGVQAVWFAVPMGWCTNYVISFVRYLTGKWSKRQLI